MQLRGQTVAIAQDPELSGKFDVAMIKPWLSERSKFLHQRDNNAIKFADIGGMSAPLAERVNLIEEQDALGGLSIPKDLPQMHCRLAQIRTDDGIEAYDVQGKTERVSQCLRGHAFPASWGTVKKKFSPPADAFLAEQRIVLGFCDNLFDHLSCLKTQRNLLQYYRVGLQREGSVQDTAPLPAINCRIEVRAVVPISVKRAAKRLSSSMMPTPFLGNRNLTRNGRRLFKNRGEPRPGRVFES